MSMDSPDRSEQASRETAASETATSPCWHTIGVWGHEEPRCPELDRVVHCRNCEIYQEAGRSMLNRVPEDDHGAEWAGALADPPPPAAGPTEPAIVFRVGHELLALPLSFVIEVHAWRV